MGGLSTGTYIALAYMCKSSTFSHECDDMPVCDEVTRVRLPFIREVEEARTEAITWKKQKRQKGREMQCKKKK
eukprot:8686240-Ditylum_brightwellii.AAC.1